MFLILGLWIFIEYYLVIEWDLIWYLYYLKRGDVCSSWDIYYFMLLLGGNIIIIMIFVSMIWILGLELIFLLIRIL